MRNRHAVIGVMPDGFQFLDGEADVILPQRFDRNRVFLGNFSYQGVARLKPGVTLQQANADVGRMLPAWLNAWPAPPGLDKKLFESARIAPALTPLKQDVVGDMTDTLWVLMGTIGVVLLIACANVANLLLVRVEGRQQELATRAALGAGWWRIARELLQESLAAWTDWWRARARRRIWRAASCSLAIGPETLPRLREITIDPIVLGFTLVASLLSGLLFGVIPVLKYSGPRARDCASRRDANVEPQPRAASRAQPARRRAGGARARAAGGVRSHDSDVSDIAKRAARLRAPRRGADAEGVDTATRSKPMPCAWLASTTTSSRRSPALPGVESAALVSSAPLERFDSNDPVVSRGQGLRRNGDSADSPVQVRLARLLSNGRHSADRRTRHHLDRRVRRPSGDDDLGEHGARDVGKCAGGTGQAHSRGQHRRLARDRRRGRRRARQRRARAGTRHRVLADHDAEVLGQRAIRVAIADVCRAQRSHEHRGVPHADPRGRLVGQCAVSRSRSCGRCRMSTSDRWRGRHSRS